MVSLIEESTDNINSKNNILERQLIFRTSSNDHAVLLYLDKNNKKITIYNTGGNSVEINKLLNYINNNEELKDRLVTAIGCESNELNIKQKDDTYYKQISPTYNMSQKL